MTADLTDTEKRDFFDACGDGRLGVVARLLAKCPEAVNFRDADGWTGLSLAVQWAQQETVCYLLEKGADASLLDRDGGSAQLLSERLNYSSITDLFHAAAALRDVDAAHAIHAAEIDKFASGLQEPIVVRRAALRLQK